MRKTRAMRKRREVRREKVRRVCVAALIVRGEGPSVSLGELAERGEAFLSCSGLRGRREDKKVGRAILCMIRIWGRAEKRTLDYERLEGKQSVQRSNRDYGKSMGFQVGEAKVVQRLLSDRSCRGSSKAICCSMKQVLKKVERKERMESMDKK